MNKLNKLEALRGFSAFYVVLHHILPSSMVVGSIDFSIIFRFGQEAVILFFLISGFVINLSFSNSSDKSFTTYFYKRFTRLYIPLFIVFFIDFVIKSIVKGNIQIPELQTIVGNLCMFQDLEFLRPNTICAPLFNNTPLWSLSYEWWFYIIYFLIQKFIRKNHHSYFIAGASILAAVTYIVFPFFGNRLIMYFTIWWTGVVISRSYLNNNKVNIADVKFQVILLTSISLLLIFNIYYNSDFKDINIGAYPYGELRHFIFSIASVLIAILWQNYNWIAFNAMLLPFCHLAKISYAMYILHYPLLPILNKLNIYMNTVFSYTLFLLLLCLLSYYIEIKLYKKIKNYADKVLVIGKSIKLKLAATN